MSIQALAYDFEAHCVMQDGVTAEEINPSDSSNIQEAVLNDTVAAIDLIVEKIHVPWEGAVTRHYTANLEVEMIELLILHGAPIDALDKEGNSPLYYCCCHKKPTLFNRGSFNRGSFNSTSFKCLVAAGADISTLHHSIIQHPETEDGLKVNLLQIVLDSELLYGGNGGHHYLSSTTDPFSRDWELMTSVLIEAGLPFDTNHPMIAKYAQTASYIGNLALLKKLLGPDVEEKARGNRSFLTDFILPFALCSAAHGSQNGVVSWLLQIGADAHVKYPNTNIPNFTKLFGNSRPQSVLSRALGSLAASAELFEILVDD
jgi:hypothetical protein